MTRLPRIAYTLLLCLPACFWFSGCAKRQDTAPSSSATTSEEDMELPTVQMPADDAGDPNSTPADDGSSAGGDK